MNKYSILASSGHNRVYFEASKKLSVAELSIALNKSDCQYIDIAGEHIANVFYITVTTEKPFSEKDILKVSKLSFCYAIFEVVSIDDVEYLKPIQNADFQFINSNISTILKYTGKTNELFTRLMLNIALNSSDFDSQDEISLLDPIAGKGTTLYEGLIAGYNVYGIEIGEKVVAESFGFMKKYLEKEKLKHTARKEKLSGANKSFMSVKHIIDIAKTKQDIKDKKQKHFELISGNSMYADKYFKKNFFNIIVGDLPYGVQHGNVTNEKQTSITRNPKELINSCIGGWYNVLKEGGTIVLAWNNFVLPRHELAQILENAGFTVFADDPYLDFVHRVDQSINRDIIVAKK